MTKDELFISVPSKTFLLGEYLALRGGPALIATTSPRFEYRFKFNQKSPTTLPFHPQSPAGKLWKRFDSTLTNCVLERSPQLLGAGSSTADFLAVYVLTAESEARKRLTERDLGEFESMLAIYRELAALPPGPVPSGLDLLAQTMGGGGQALVWVDWRKDSIKNAKPTIEIWHWPHDELGFALVKTGVKLSTHQHLQSLREITAAEWVELNNIMSSLKSKNSDGLLMAIRNYHHQLKKMDLVAPTTLELLAKWSAIPELAFKGCGALGADLIAIVYPKYLEAKVHLELGSDGVIFASQRDLSPGLEVRGGE